MSPECTHFLTKGQVLTDILRTAVVLPPTVLEVPHPPAPPTGGVAQLKGCRLVAARLRTEHLNQNNKQTVFEQ